MLRIIQIKNKQRLKVRTKRETLTLSERRETRGEVFWFERMKLGEKGRFGFKV